MAQQRAQAQRTVAHSRVAQFNRRHGLVTNKNSPITALGAARERLGQFPAAADQGEAGEEGEWGEVAVWDRRSGPRSSCRFSVRGSLDPASGGDGGSRGCQQRPGHGRGRRPSWKTRDGVRRCEDGQTLGGGRSAAGDGAGAGDGCSEDTTKKGGREKQKGNEMLAGFNERASGVIAEDGESWLTKQTASSCSSWHRWARN